MKKKKWASAREELGHARPCSTSSGVVLLVRRPKQSQSSRGSRPPIYAKAWDIYGDASLISK